MGSKIKVLSEETINQIAAGEVIEHPASVVKELVENSLDAGSRHITVEVLAGGFQLIRITDDGCGMSQDDAILSLERHATSKVRTIDDLLHISSMGFRGEALASIAAISKLTLTTNSSEKHEGISVVCEGGKIKRVDPCPRTRGTTLEIKSLFYTVPARKKFQKSPAQALVDIHKTVTALALARPDVHMRLISHEHSMLDTTQVTMKGRIEEVLGKDYAQEIIPVLHEEPWIKIEGFIGSPTKVRSNRMGQHLFINTRNVSSAALSYAVSDGYGTMLGIKKYPVFVLHLTMNTELLDVNVHPQKKEVRFKEEGVLKEVVRKAVALSLQAQHAPVALVKSEACFAQGPSLFFGSIDQKKLQDAKEFCVQTVKTTHSLPVPSKQVLPWKCGMLPQIEDLNIIGIHRHYLLLEGERAEGLLQPPYLRPPYNGLLLLDLQGAAARIYFEAVCKGSEQILDRQTLLFPLTLHVTKSEALLIEQELSLIKSLGIDIRAFGEQVFMVDACAGGLDEERIQELLEQLMDELKKGGRSHIEQQKKLAIRSSKLMHQNKKSYHIAEAKKLVHELLKTDNPYFCPLGNKTLAYLSVDDYAKLFSK